MTDETTRNRLPGARGAIDTSRRRRAPVGRRPRSTPARQVQRAPMTARPFQLALFLHARLTGSAKHVVTCLETRTRNIGSPMSVTWRQSFHASTKKLADRSEGLAARPGGGRSKYTSSGVCWSRPRGNLLPWREYHNDAGLRCGWGTRRPRASLAGRSWATARALALARAPGRLGSSVPCCATAAVDRRMPALDARPCAVREGSMVGRPREAATCAAHGRTRRGPLCRLS